MASFFFAVHGAEYAFGAHDFPTSGVFEVEPRQCPGFRFRKSIFIGTTCLDPIQVRQFMELHSVNYNGDTYHLITKNCNYFCKNMCYKLTGNKIPKWVNRLARIGTIALNTCANAYSSSTISCSKGDSDLMRLIVLSQNALSSFNSPWHHFFLFYIIVSTLLSRNEVYHGYRVYECCVVVLQSGSTFSVTPYRNVLCNCAPDMCIHKELSEILHYVFSRLLHSAACQLRGQCQFWPYRFMPSFVFLLY
jgi:hypothetical protein